MKGTTVSIIALLAALFLGGCDRGQPLPAGVPAETPNMLRVYSVPPERAESLREALISALGDNARVSLLPPDKLLVLASAPLQTSVAENLGRLIETAAAVVADPGPVRLTLWIVDVADSDVPDRRLAPMQQTLDAVRESLAAPGFQLLSQLAITASASDRGSASAGDDNAQLRARLSAATDGVNAELDITSGNRTQVRTQTRLKFGETVLLAQAMPSEAGRSRVRLIIVRADPAG